MKVQKGNLKFNTTGYWLQNLAILQLNIVDQEPNLEKLEPNLEKLEPDQNNQDGYDLYQINATSTTNLWHKRLGHIGKPALEALAKNTTGLTSIEEEDLDPKNLDPCEIYTQASLTKNVSKQPRENRGQYYGDLIESDIGGPISPLTKQKNKYYVTYLDDYTKYLEIRLLKQKDQVIKETEDFFRELNNQIKPLKLSIRRFHSDGAPEFKAINTNQFGIKDTTTGSYAPQQNPAVERINRTLAKKLRSLLYQARLPRKYWGEALNMAVYLYNMTPHKSLGLKTLYEAKTGQKPNISHIRIFGSLAYRVTIKPKKLDPRGDAYYLVGYQAPNIYRLLDPKRGKITISRDVKIYEDLYYKHLKEIPTEYPDLQDLTPKKDIGLELGLKELDLENLDPKEQDQSDLARQIR